MWRRAVLLAVVFGVVLGTQGSVAQGAAAGSTVDVWGTAPDPFIVVDNAPACALRDDGTAPDIEITIDRTRFLYRPDFQQVQLGNSFDYRVNYYNTNSFTARLILLMDSPPSFDVNHRVMVRCGQGRLDSVGTWSGKLAEGNFHAGFVGGRGDKHVGMVLAQDGMAYPCEQPSLTFKGTPQSADWAVNPGQPFVSRYEAVLPFTDGLNEIKISCGGRTWRMALVWNGISPRIVGAAGTVPQAQPDLLDAPFVRAVPAPSDLPWDPIALAATLMVLMLLVVVLVGFPAEVVNETIKNNEAEISGWFARLRRPGLTVQLGQAARFLVFIVMAALLMTFVDPRAGFNGSTAMVLAALAVTVPVVTLAYALPKEWYVRWRMKQSGPFRAVPAGLGLAFALAAVSRLAAFVPGYTYGLIGTFDPRNDPQARKPRENVEAAGILIGVAVTLALAGFAFWRLNDVHASASLPQADLVLKLEDAIYCSLFVLGVQTVVFGLLPLRGMDGGRLRRWQESAAPRWSRWGWVGGYTVASFLFLHALILNREAAVGSPEWIPTLARALGIFIAFAALSFAFRGWFTLSGRPGRLAVPEPESAPEPELAGGEPGALLTAAPPTAPASVVTRARLIRMGVITGLILAGLVVITIVV
ncbi:hypothetical protein Rhe02_62710 [Rhizocola hellebori]|uniref:Uncharacterized protein n=1 Tax=Rhizocola hellebori TaxID=1392758 RepID=A0A8J3QCF3_9ACTN|nr:FGLLP motif-containing membrane protein [Rhizocola hellebori]GIH08204.1 hypothetical protein Rhe02_62710 [Rhizocola hellebori]